MNFYLIDDDHDDQEFFQLAIDTLEHSVTCVTASNGIDALRKLHTDSDFVPDLIFIDMNMPRMSGGECIREIRKIPRLNDVPLILYSTSDPGIGNQVAMRAGADYFFTKPASIPGWVAAIENVVKEMSMAYKTA